ncbi:MAG: hypothetical protein GY795_45205 [Desulfobacterales bacterium]|nr:hypothetical protein [Desulfobacterales bacterium]
MKIVEWSEEDGCYVGTAPGLIYGGVHGDNEVEVYRELVEAVEEAIELYRQEGNGALRTYYEKHTNQF